MIILHLKDVLNNLKKKKMFIFVDFKDFIINHISKFCCNNPLL